LVFSVAVGLGTDGGKLQIIDCVHHMLGAGRRNAHDAHPDSRGDRTNPRTTQTRKKTMYAFLCRVGQKIYESRRPVEWTRDAGA